MRNAVLPLAIFCLAHGARDATAADPSADPSTRLEASAAPQSVSAPATGPASARPALDSAASRNQLVRDSLAVHHKHIRDSIAARQKFVHDSLAARRKTVSDSVAARLKYARDSTAAARAERDSVAAVKKAQHDDSLKAAKAHRDSLALAAKKTRSDSLHAAALAQAAAVQARADSMKAARAAKAHTDSLAVATKKAHDDSVRAAVKAKADSARAAAKAKADSARAAAKAKADSTRAAAKAKAHSVQVERAAKDSVAAFAKAAAKAKADSISAAKKTQALAKAAADKAAAQARTDSLKALKAAKAHADSLAALAKKAHGDSLRAAVKAKADSARTVAKARIDSAKAAARLRADMLKAAMVAKESAARAAARARADSIAASKVSRDSAAAAARAAQHQQDSTLAKSFRIMSRPLNKNEIKDFLDKFRMKDTGRPESTAVNWIYRDQAGAVLTYESGVSEVGFAYDSVSWLDKKEYVPDSLIRLRTDALLRELIPDKADRYAFANYEITSVQKKSTDANGSVSPPVPAFYTGRYIRKLENRLVLGDAFQIRITYGGGGKIQSFSFRDPELVESQPVKVPARQFIVDSLVRWASSRTRPRTILYPYHTDRLRIREIKPLKVLETYVLAEEKFRESPQANGTYLVPAVTVLAQVSLYPSARKSKDLVPEPILLHFHFPCRPGAGLCWPDGKQTLE